MVYSLLHLIMMTNMENCIEQQESLGTGNPNGQLTQATETGIPGVKRLPKQNKISRIRPRTNFETGKGILSETYYHIMPYTQRTKLIAQRKHISLKQESTFNKLQSIHKIRENSLNKIPIIPKLEFFVQLWGYFPDPIHHQFFSGDQSPEMHPGISPGLRVQLHPD